VTLLELIVFASSVIGLIKGAYLGAGYYGIPGGIGGERRGRGNHSEAQSSLRTPKRPRPHSYAVWT
jgi:hypothetical protein